MGKPRGVNPGGGGGGKHDSTYMVLPAKSDSDVVFCLQLLSKTLTCILHFTVVPRPLSNDPRFTQCIYRYSRASKRFVEV